MMTAVLNLAVTIWILIDSSSFSTQGNQEMTSPDILLVLKKMKLSGGSTLIIVKDHPLNITISTLLENWRTGQEFKQISFQFDSFEVSLPSILGEILKKDSLDCYKSVLNFVAFCQDYCLPMFLQMLSQADLLHGQQSLLRHFAKVLVVFTKEMDFRVFYSETRLDNLAIAFQGPRTESEKREVLLMTLLWTKEGRSCAHMGDTAIELFQNIKYGLNGRKLKIAALEWVNYCKRDVSKDDRSETFTQTCKEFADYLSETLNFTYVFVQPTEKTWGLQLSNSTWTGLLGMISTKEADFSIISYGRTLRRKEGFSFSYSIISSQYRCAYLKEFSNRNDWVALVSGFKLEVYMWGFLTAFWCVILTLLLEKSTKEENHTRSLKEKQFHKIIDILSVALHKGTAEQPYTCSGRILLVAWWIFCVIMTTIYTGNLIAFLAISKEIVPFRTLAGLAENQDYKLFIPHGSYIEDQIKNSNSVIMKKLWRKTLENRKYQFDNTSDERKYTEEQLRSGKSVLLDIEEEIDDVEERVNPLGRMQGNVQTIHMALPFPPHSPLEPLISQILMRSYDTGVLDGLHRKWLKRHPVNESGRKSASQLKITHFKSALTACAVGIILSCVCLAVEKVYTKSKHSASIR